MSPEEQRIVNLVIERGEQACRYAVKHQDFSADEVDYRSGFEVGAEVCESAIRRHVLRHIEEDLIRKTNSLPAVNCTTTDLA